MRVPGFGVARENAARPLIVSRTLIGIPRAGIRSAVEDQVLLGIVRDPPPRRAATDSPGIRRPACNAEILPLILWIKRMKVSADQDVSVRTRVISAPRYLSVRSMQSCEPTTNAELAAAVAD